MSDTGAYFKSGVVPSLSPVRFGMPAIFLVVFLFLTQDLDSLNVSGISNWLMLFLLSVTQIIAIPLMLWAVYKVTVAQAS